MLCLLFALAAWCSPVRLNMSLLHHHHGQDGDPLDYFIATAMFSGIYLELGFHLFKGQVGVLLVITAFFGGLEGSQHA